MKKLMVKQYTYGPKKWQSNNCESYDKVINIVSAYYTPQMRCEENQKKQFWQEMNEVMQEISGTENPELGMI